MTFSWNPFSMAEFDDSKIVIRFPNSGHFARITGPIVELLSQLPFTDLDSALQSWQDRTGVKDSVLRKAVAVWKELQEGEIILRLPSSEGAKFRPSQCLTLARSEGPSHLFRFMDSQDLQLEDEGFSICPIEGDDDFWSADA
jgi:hypothetical protein